jgi:hypothetical protein
MAIDNPYDAIDQQYPEDEGALGSAIAKVLGMGAALGIPMPPFVSQFFGFLDSMSSKAKQERGTAFIHQLVEDIQKVQASTKRSTYGHCIRRTKSQKTQDFHSQAKDTIVA